MTHSHPQLEDQDRLAEIGDFFWFIRGRADGEVKVLREGVEWHAATAEDFDPPSRPDPQTMDEALRWCALFRAIPECDPSTFVIMYRDIAGAKLRANGGPESDFNGAVRFIERELTKAPDMADRQSVKILVPANDNNPIDPWKKQAPPFLPTGLLPSVIEDFATVQGELMGVDAGGMAMAALAVCAAAIPDSITIQPKRHDQQWQESARLWVALIGNPSTKKSPTIAAAVAPLRRLDRDLFRQYEAAKHEYDALDKADKAQQSPPANVRLCLGDTTIEAAQDVLKHSREGVLLIQDELSGWFGAMDKYSGSGRGAAADRSFWLQAFNGGPYSVNRVGRGASMIDNLSVSLLGGIQPEPIRAIARDAHDDGLLQRLFPIVLQTARPGTDKPTPPVVAAYDALIERLHGLRRPMRGSLQEVPVRFDAEAQAVWEALTADNFKLGIAWEEINKKLAAHVGKLDGLFARLCLVWHCIESSGNRPASVITADVASRVSRFMREFLFPHAVAFYTDILGLSDRQDELLATAGWILAHRPQQITARDVRRGDRTMRNMDTKDAEAVLEQLDALKWLTPLPVIRRDSRAWMVNGAVYVKFDLKAAAEAERREAIRMTIQSTFSG